MAQSIGWVKTQTNLVQRDEGISHKMFNLSHMGVDTLKPNASRSLQSELVGAPLKRDYVDQEKNNSDEVCIEFGSAFEGGQAIEER